LWERVRERANAFTPLSPALSLKGRGGMYRFLILN
jgi:hypothetical protein